ncbi:MAG: choice-of-anchor Q domain-containing protein [Solirubrobacteraceae bacterium]
MRDVMRAKVRRPGAAVAAAAVILWACPSLALAASTFTVTGTGDPTGATCAGTACQSLRAAIAAADASPGSTVRLGATTYTLSQSALTVAPSSGSVTIAGAGTGSQGTAIVQTRAGSRVVKVTGTEPVTLNGVELTGGALTGRNGHPGHGGGNADGGGIFNASAPLTLIHVSVIGNTATAGTGGTGTSVTPFGGVGGEAVGGIYSSGRLTLTDSVVSSNVARAGRGGKGAPATAQGNGGYGGRAVGGILAHASTGPTSIVGSTISGNNAKGGAAGIKGGGTIGGGGGSAAGGLASDAQAVTLTNTTVTSNSATGGAGITADTQSSGGNAYGGLQLSDMAGAGLTVSGSTLSTNGAQGGAGGGGGFALGGAITVAGMKGTLSGSTITGNHATAGNSHGGSVPAIGGGGVFIEPGTTLRLTRTTIAQNAVTGGTSTTGSGGAVCGGGVNNEGKATFVDDTVAGNTATGGPGPAGGFGGSAVGAGMCLYSFGTTVVNSTITGNLAVGGSGGSASGAASGGGVALQAGPADFANATLAGNGASTGAGGSATGGNLLVLTASGVELTLADTIIAGGTVVGGASNSNCKLAAAQVVDQKHNLESTSPSECGLGAGDLIGTDPKLSALAANGGPTQTMALAAGSPAIGAGGACKDPSGAGAPRLTTDQRGRPRRLPCDIGAFQAQRPVHTAAPRISGVAALGRMLTCSKGKWSGDLPLTYTYTWSRHGSVIPGAKSSKYTVARADIGRKLSCKVTARNRYGSAAAASPFVSVPPKPSITRVSQAHQRWRESSQLAKLSGASAKRHPVGTSFSFTLNTPATLVLTFTHTFHGRRVSGKCVRTSRHNRHHHACTLPRTDGLLMFRNVSAGAHKISFGGRLGTKGSLGVRSHTLTITAVNSSGSTASKALQFTIVKR